MKIFSAEQIRRWDAYTIQHEPIASIDLIERAATKCTEWILKNGFTKASFKIFCGKGNNGADGLAIARLLQQHNNSISVFIPEDNKEGSLDFHINLQRLLDLSISVNWISSKHELALIEKDDVVIDALFGTGLRQPLYGINREIVQHINSSTATIISIDLPSGLFPDASSIGNTIINAKHTLSFQTYKLGLLLAENASHIGEVHLLDIGLNEEFYKNEPASFTMSGNSFISSLIQPRNRFSHKGSFGHALLIGGSHGKMGAMVLCASACARSGCGLLTAYVPQCGYTIMQISVPEAMVLVDENIHHLSYISVDHSRYSALGIGPGMDLNAKTISAFKTLIACTKVPMVIDADGLNILSQQPDLLIDIPKNSVLTPHLKEFERLFGKTKNEVERIYKAIEKAREFSLVVVLKGHYTLIALPDGRAFFNSTGNAGMAKGGSGDVLTGIITSLIAQGYEPSHATIIGVYLHGMAGDFAALELGQNSMLASDINKNISKAFQFITKRYSNSL